MSKYPVLSEEQAQQARFSLLKEGVYRGKIIHSLERVSASNNDMYELIVKVYHDKVPYEIKDFLILTHKMVWKLIHCARSCGLEAEYLSATLIDETLMNQDVFIQIGIDKGKEIPKDRLNGKPPGSRYPDKNIIVDYLVESEIQDKIEPLSHAKDEFINDDLPF